MFKKKPKLQKFLPLFLGNLWGPLAGELQPQSPSSLWCSEKSVVLAPHLYPNLSHINSAFSPHYLVTLGRQVDSRGSFWNMAR